MLPRCSAQRFFYLLFSLLLLGLQACIEVEYRMEFDENWNQKLQISATMPDSLESQATAWVKLYQQTGYTVTQTRQAGKLKIVCNYTVPKDSGLIAPYPGDLADLIQFDVSHKLSKMHDWTTIHLAYRYNDSAKVAMDDKGKSLIHIRYMMKGPGEAGDNSNHSRLENGWAVWESDVRPGQKMDMMLSLDYTSGFKFWTALVFMLLALLIGAGGMVAYFKSRKKQDYSTVEPANANLDDSNNV